MHFLSNVIDLVSLTYFIMYLTFANNTKSNIKKWNIWNINEMSRNAMAYVFCIATKLLSLAIVHDLGNMIWIQDLIDYKIKIDAISFTGCKKPKPIMYCT